MKDRLISILFMLLLLLVGGAIGLRQGQLLGYSLEGKSKEIRPPDLTQIKKLFVKAEFFRAEPSDKKGEIYHVHGASGKFLGRVLDSRGLADDVIGMQGPRLS